LREGEVGDEVIVSAQLFLGLSVESIDVVVIEFPNDNSFISGSGNQESGVFSIFAGVSSLEGSDPSVVSRKKSFISEFG
jgi:hypothetical protein